MTADLLACLAAILLSLACSYVPGLARWYQQLDPTYKRLVMLVLLVLAAGGAFSLGCSGWGSFFGLTLACDRPTAAGLVRALVVALVANQSTYLLSPKKSPCDGPDKAHDMRAPEVSTKAVDAPEARNPGKMQ